MCIENTINGNAYCYRPSILSIKSPFAWDPIKLKVGWGLEAYIRVFICPKYMEFCHFVGPIITRGFHGFRGFSSKTLEI